MVFVFQMNANGAYTNEINFDGANGVGAIAMQGLMNTINTLEAGTMQVNTYNGNVENGQLLNSNCGADFVKVQQRSPENFEHAPSLRCVSFDGDADRVVYFYTDKSGVFRLLDGDRIATLIAGYLKELLRQTEIELNLGLVQTAYANGSSTEYITTVLVSKGHT